MLNRLSWGRRLSALGVGLLIALGSCRDLPTGPSTPATPPPANDPSKSLLGLFGPPRLLSCPTSDAQSTSGLIGTDGGTLSLGGTSVTIPVGALLEPTTVELTIPAGQYMEVDLTVNGGQHTTFPQPVVVTIDYSRCNRFSTLFKLLSVWNIDPSNKALLENMGGIDNKLAQSIAFETLHFSGFAIAY
jgi:hypothetical protein